MNARNCREIGVDGGLCYREATVRRGWKPPHAPALFGFSFSATAPHHLSEATSHLTRGSSRRGPVRWQVPFGRRATGGRHVKGRAGLAAVLGGQKRRRPWRHPANRALRRKGRLFYLPRQGP